MNEKEREIPQTENEQKKELPEPPRRALPLDDRLKSILQIPVEDESDRARHLHNPDERR